MTAELLIGSAMIIATVLVECLFIAAAISMLKRAGPWLVTRGPFLRRLLALGGLTLWLLGAITVCLWLWAGLFLFLGEFDSLREALYFATVSGTTVGYGDLVLSERWYLLGGLLAANGLVLFSLNTAFLFEVLRRLGEVDADDRAMR
jgi:hypothetical protein